MGFFAAKSKGLRSTDPLDRLKALNTIDDGKQDQLATIARNDSDARVRVAAAHRVSDNRRLQDLLSASDADVVRIARERLAGVAVKLALGQPLDRCRSVLDAINEQKSLAELALSASDNAVKAVALDRLLAQPEPSPALLVMIAVQDASGVQASRAVERIERKGLLKDVARKAKSQDIRTQAEQRAAALADEQQKPSAEKIRKARLAELSNLLPIAQRYAVASDLDRTAGEWPALLAKRDAVLAEQADIPIDESVQAINARIDRAHSEFQARRLAEQDRQTAVLITLERLLSEAEALTPASDGQSDARAALQSAWTNAGELPAARRGDLDARFRAALVRAFPAMPAPVATVADAAPAIDPAESLAPEQRAELEQISVDSEQLATSTDWRDAQDRYRVLHKRWNLLSAALPHDHALKTRFLTAYATFKDRHRAWRDGKRDETDQRIKTLEGLTREAETLAGQTPADDAAAKAHYQTIRDLQQRWKQVGPVRVDLIQGLRNRFRAAIDLAYAPVRSLREAEDWERFQNLAKADELIASVDALATVEDFAAIAKSVKQAQAAWKELGPLPGERREAAWQRFRTACDAQFTRCKPYFDQLDVLRQDNLVKKRALISEAETIVGTATQAVGLSGSPADLQAKKAAVERMKAIQQEWKAIGPVPREADEEVWTRFRALCDTFFSQHKGEIDARRQEQQQNLNLKVALCLEIEDLAKDIEEAIAANDERKLKPAPERLKLVKELQLSWKNIGHVPREQVETIWTRFRTACDRVYATCQEHLAAQEAERQGNLKKKQALLDEAEGLLAHENARWFKDDLQALQRQWREIGYVPREAMEALNARSKDVFDRIFALLREA